MSTPAQVASLLSSGGFHVEDWEVARILSALPQVAPSDTLAPHGWDRVRQFAGSVLSDDDYAARFDPYWHRVQGMVFGAAASPESASLAIDGARVMVVKLESMRSANEAVAEADLPPYIPPKTSNKPPDIIDTPTQQPRPKGPGLLPILIAVGFSAALVTIHRRSL